MYPCRSARRLSPRALRRGYGGTTVNQGRTGPAEHRGPVPCDTLNR